MRLIACVLLLICSTAASAQPCRALQEYDEVLSIVTERFYDQTFRGLDWDSRVAYHRDQVNCEDDEQALAAIVNRLLSELNASHTALYTTDDLDYWALQSIFSGGNLDAYEIDFSGIWPEQHDGIWYAKYVLLNSPAEKAGVLSGDELISIDGGDFRPLGFNEDSISTLIVSSDGSTTREIPIRAARQSIQRFFLDATESSRRIVPVGEKRIGYFHLWSGQPLTLESLNSALASFEEARVDALIVDLRGGFGGMGRPYLEKLRESPYLVGIPKYFLIDDGSRSGKELVAGIIKRAGIGTLVGSTTAGNYLGASPFRLFDEKYFLYVAIGGGGEIPGIGVIEGVGIEPDVAVAPCRTYCSGHDPQLERVLELIAG